MVSSDRGKRGHTCGRAAEGERNTEGANEMKVFTNEFEDKLVNFIGTSVVVFIILLLVGIVGGIEQGLLWKWWFKGFFYYVYHIMKEREVRGYVEDRFGW